MTICILKKLSKLILTIIIVVKLWKLIKKYFIICFANLNAVGTKSYGHKTLYKTVRSTKSHILIVNTAMVTSTKSHIWIINTSHNKAMVHISNNNVLLQAYCDASKNYS